MKLLRSSCLFTLAIWLALPGTVFAQDRGEELLLSYGDADFISIATGQQQPLSEAPAVATVITAQQIKAMGAANLDQVLETVPGLHVSLSSNRFSPIYSMRGIYTDKNPQVLMLVDGIPLTQLYFGDRGIKNSLPVSNIARVEVIRGPGSAVYGADAFSGVINVITKTAAQIGGTELGFRGGSFDTQELWLLHGSKWGEVDFSLSLDVFKTAGDGNRVIESDTQSLFDNAFGITASLAPGAADTDEKRADLRIEFAWKGLEFSVWNWRQEGGVGPGLALALDPTGIGRVDNYLVDLKYLNNSSFDNWEYEARLTYADINTESEQTLFPPGAIIPLGSDGNVEPASPVGIAVFSQGMIGNPEVYEQHVRADGSAFYTGFRRHTLRIASGINYAELNGKESKNYGPGVIDPVLPSQVVDGVVTSVTDTPYIFIPDKSRRNYYGSLQDEWSFAADWNLTWGLRYDNYSDFGSTVNPRAALVWNTSQKLTSKLLYGRAFRAPSFAELFSINNPVALGNPDLEPETINTYEVAFDYSATYDLRTGLNVFYYQIDDLIRFLPGPSGTGSRAAQNSGEQTGYGFELEAEWHLLESLSLAGHYAFQRSRFEELDSDVGHSPGQQLYGQIRWAFAPHWEFSTQAKWIADRKRDDGDPRPEIDNYTLVDLVLRRMDIVKHLDIDLIVQNLLDEEAFEPSPGEGSVPGGSLVPGDFPLTGRGIYLKLGYRF